MAFEETVDALFWSAKCDVFTQFVWRLLVAQILAVSFSRNEWTARRHFRCFITHFRSVGDTCFATDRQKLIFFIQTVRHQVLIHRLFFISRCAVHSDEGRVLGWCVVVPPIFVRLQQFLAVCGGDR